MSQVNLLTGHCGWYWSLRLVLFTGLNTVVLIRSLTELNRRTKMATANVKIKSYGESLKDSNPEL
ncbi:hypothetical protein [Scytonema sp. PCC 10023]|uniref:hypothetical protein n=1 Tax=Scytonema sp. PCC 10023 TaxID=1680591 RepID=UPI0039C5AA4C